MAEKEQKLGPNVTYVGQGEGDKVAATVQGVRFMPGESVNLEERLGKEESAKVLQKLAGNQYFKVDGGPDHAAMAQKKAEAEQKQAEQLAKQDEEDRKAQEQQQGMGGSPMERNKPTPPPPENWQGPEEEGLEKQPTSRKPK